MDTTPGKMMAATLAALHYSVARVARETGIARTTIARMLQDETLGTTEHRRALTAWGRKVGLVMPGDSWWTAMHRAAMEHEVGRAVGRAVGAGLSTCPSCGEKLDEVKPADEIRGRITPSAPPEADAVPVGNSASGTEIGNGEGAPAGGHTSVSTTPPRQAILPASAIPGDPR